MSIPYSLSTILHLANQISKKKTVLCKLKFKAIFFIYTHNFRGQNLITN